MLATTLSAPSTSISDAVSRVHEVPLSGSMSGATVISTTVVSAAVAATAVVAEGAAVVPPPSPEPASSSPQAAARNVATRATGSADLNTVRGVMDRSSQVRPRSGESRQHLFLPRRQRSADRVVRDEPVVVPDEHPLRRDAG